MKNLKFILLIDDNEIDNIIHTNLIRNLNIAEFVLAFQNGLEAINYFRVLKEIDICPDLILLDLSMPTMDGFEFMLEYQELPPEKRKAKVIVVSSSTNPKDIKKAETLGCSAYIVKPVTDEKIKKVLKLASKP